MAERPIGWRLAAALALSLGLGLQAGLLTGAAAQTAASAAVAAAPTATPTPTLAAPLSADPALEARVMKVAEELRCLVCQNETIAASQADLAVDLRKQIRLKLQAGQSERDILDFMVARYGDFVRYRPPLNASTLMLWAGPFALLLVAGFALILNIRKRRLAEAPQALSPEQAQRARDLLGIPPHQS
jgi:cytochrome c-type biogenesis protein CcmH